MTAMDGEIRNRLTQALHHHGQGRLDAAEKLYREVLQRAPDNPDALNLLGVMKHQRGDAAAAEELIQRAIAGKADVASYWNNLGNVQAAQGRLEDAAKAYERAVALQPDDALALVNLGFVLKNLGRVDSAVEKYRRAVELQPTFAEAYGKLGVALTQQEKLDEAAAQFRKALELKPDYVEARASLGNVLRTQGFLDDAAGHYEEVLKARPDFAEIHLALGLVRRQQGKPNEAAECFRRAIKIKRDYAEAHHNLGDIRMEQGRLDEARKCYKRALEADPEYPEALSHLGVIQRRRGAAIDAVALFERALKVKPDFAEALANLGIAFLDMGKREAAEPYLIRALELRPDFPEAIHNLGLLRYLQQRLDDAEMLFRRSLELRPDFAEAHNNLGIVLKDKGRLDEALKEARRALEIKPDFAEAHTALIFSLDFVIEAGFAEHQAERKRWFERFGKRYAAVSKRHPNEPDPERKLRIGYVSADFRRHSAVFSFGPVLRNHDRSHFEVTCYSSVPVEDDVTADLKAHVDHWRPVLGTPDEDLAGLIRRDKIDILIDLSGHSHGNRLMVFARKPAPVQVTAWGHCTGTGVPMIDYLFADPVTIPADVRAHFAETVYDLPCAIGYEAPSYAPEVMPPPASRGRPLTFGSFNRLSKVTAMTVALWARLLTAVPGTRLLLKDRQLHGEAERNRMIAAFAAHGIAAERLELQGGSSHPAHMAAMSEVDIGLDPFPQNGGISTLEPLWMGVPVIARLGNSVPSRIASGVLTAAGLADWVAVDDEAYIEIARRKAADIGGLVALRAEQRRRLSETAVGNPRLYTGAVEDAYRTMWRRWCVSRG